MHYYASDIEDISFSRVRGKMREGDIYETAYKWLARYIGYYPPLWLSRDYHKLTGYGKGSKKILFGFNDTEGTGVSYDEWMIILGVLINIRTDDFVYASGEVEKELVVLSRQGSVDLTGLRGVHEFMKKYVLLPTSDQIVVRQLDLRESKTIICCDQVQKTTLVRRGFTPSAISVVYNKW